MTRWGTAKNNIHHYKRYGRGDAVALTANLTGFNTAALTFSLNDVTNYQELLTIYDQYKIDNVQIRINWSPKITLGVNVNAPGQSTYPVMYYFKDFDDSSPPATLATMKERGNLRQVRINPNRVYTIFIKPAVLSEVKTVGGLSASKPTWNNILDVANFQVPHFGLKLGFDHLINQEQGAIDIEVVYNLTMFGTR